jgi:hypothetical protein
MTSDATFSPNLDVHTRVYKSIGLASARELDGEIAGCLGVYGWRGLYGNTPSTCLNCRGYHMLSYQAMLSADRRIW